MLRVTFIAALLLLPYPAAAADAVPYSIRYIKPAGAGYIELVGPGDIRVNGETRAYEGTQYIATRNIDSMTADSATAKGCTLHYSSENYSETIAVTQQSCSELISIIGIVSK